MKRRMQTILRSIGGLTLAAALVAFAIYLPRWMTGNFGQALALCSASLLQPQQGLRTLVSEWRATPAYDAAPPAVVTETVSPPLSLRDTAEQSPPSLTEAAVIPPKGDGGGTVIEERIGGGKALSDTVYYKNNSGFDRDFAALLGRDAGIRFEDTDEPQVLIVHSHTTESYMTYYAGYFNNGDCIRTADISRNMCVVGEVLAGRLRAAGIAVIHDTSVHDFPQYNGAYDRSAEVVKQAVAQYPSLKLVLDLHRDALGRDDVTKVKPTVTVGGEKAAQMMLVIGASDNDDAPNPYWETNVTLGLQIQDYLSQTYDGLMRPISFTESRYNQQLFAGFLLIEMGSDVNTFAEASYSARLLGDALLHLLG